mgnify:CR=1 FL=1
MIKRVKARLPIININLEEPGFFQKFNIFCEYYRIYLISSHIESNKYFCNFKENFNIEEDKLKINGIKITSFTKMNDNIICGPTPMLNPAMLVPIEETEVRCGDSVRIRLEYVMGGGVETIKTEILEIIHKD